MLSVHKLVFSGSILHQDELEGVEDFVKVFTDNDEVYITGL